MSKSLDGLIIGSFLKQVLEKHPAFSANPLGDWEALVGPQIAKNCQPKSLKKKVLVVVAYDSVWKHHLEMYREALLEKINRGRPEPLVEKIVIRVGELPDDAPVLNPHHKMLEKIKPTGYRGKRKKKRPSRPLTKEEKALLAQLSDPDLKKIGARLLKKLPL